MCRLTNCSYFIAIHILHLLFNSRDVAAALTYDECISDSAKSYKVGGWCFYFYRDSSWASNQPTQDDAQSVCLPHGTLAVGVTYNMLNVYKNQYTSALIPYVWLGLVRNTSYTFPTQGWYWRALLPTGDYTTFPAIMSNTAWAVLNPNNLYSNEDTAILQNSLGVVDVQKNIPAIPYGPMKLAVLCQFAPSQWSFSQRGHGRFANSAYILAQTTATELVCAIQCYKSLFCIALAFSPVTNDCQIYAVSPEDQRFSGDVVVDSSYNWYIRDGMEY